ncbi:MAG: M20/M25/M40 family metallo-hydrolase, partial [Oscillospiraceae bacterium]
GTLDSKCNIYIQLQAIEELLQQGYTPPCDVYVEASINEETGGDGAAGAVRYLQEHNITLALVIDEGGAIIEEAMPGMTRPYAVIGVTEKGYIDLKITATGSGGHSSTPPRNTPAARLFAFANDIEKKH